MTLGERFSLVAKNVALLIPVYILLIASAVMTSIGASKMANLTGTSNAHTAVSWVTAILWIIVAGSLIFAFTFGLFVLPALVLYQYIYAGLMVLFSLLNLVLAGIIFYGANTVRISDEYKKGTEDAKSAFKNLLISGILMVVSAFFVIIYTVYTTIHYRREGGLTKDVAIAGQVGSKVATALGQPEIAVPLQAVGSIAEQELKPEQRTGIAEGAGKAGQIAGAFQELPEFSQTGQRLAPGVTRAIKQ